MHDAAVEGGEGGRDEGFEEVCLDRPSVGSGGSVDGGGERKRGGVTRERDELVQLVVDSFDAIRHFDVLHGLSC